MTQHCCAPKANVPLPNAVLVYIKASWSISKHLIFAHHIVIFL